MHICRSIYKNIYVYICIYIHIYVYIYVYIYVLYGQVRWAPGYIEGPPRLWAPEGGCISFSPKVRSKVWYTMLSKIQLRMEKVGENADVRFVFLTCPYGIHMQYRVHRCIQVYEDINMHIHRCTHTVPGPQVHTCVCIYIYTHIDVLCRVCVCARAH